MCPLLKCASNYLRTAAPQFLDVMERRGIKTAIYLFFSIQKTILVLVFRFFYFVLLCFPFLCILLVVLQTVQDAP